MMISIFTFGAIALGSDVRSRLAHPESPEMNHQFTISRSPPCQSLPIQDKNIAFLKLISRYKMAEPLVVDKL